MSVAVAPALVASLTLGWVGDPQGLDLKPWLTQAGVRAVAVLLVPEACSGCKAAERDLAKLTRRYRPRGLRTIVVMEAGEDTCRRPEWADHVLCGGGKVFAAYRASKASPTGLLWDWRGRLIAQGGAARMRGAMARTKIRVTVQAGGRDIRAVRLALEAAARGTGKLTPQPQAGAPRLSEAACPAGYQPGARLALAAKAARGKLRAQLLDPNGGCRVSEATVSLAARPLQDAASEAVGRLIYPLIQTPEVPSLGVASAVERAGRAGRAAPGVLIDPGAAAPEPVPRPVEAPASGGPLTVAPGGLVDPNDRRRYGGGGGNLQAVASSWVGTRYLLDGDDRGGIDDKHLVQNVFRDVYGVDLGHDLATMLRSGPEVAFDPKHPSRSLQPGDLLFYVSYAYLPRSVMLYLGNGKILTSQLIRGVQIDDSPSNVPHYLYLVARRPLAGPPASE